MRAGWLGAAALCPSHVPSRAAALASGPVNHLLVLSGARRLLNGSQIENT